MEANIQKQECETATKIRNFFSERNFYSLFIIENFSENEIKHFVLHEILENLNSP